jgi:oligopeptide transport system substrate-binding protein
VTAAAVPAAPGSAPPRRASRHAIAVAVGLALLLGACTPSDAPEDEPAAPSPVVDEPEPDEVDAGPQRGGTLRVGLSADPVTIDPRFLVDEAGELVVDALFDPLVRIDEDLRVVPAAAASYEVGDDGRTLTFTLREATFHDGTPVTAADFKRSFDRIVDGTAEPRSFLAYLLEPVVGAVEAQEEGGGLDGVQAVDERTLRIELTEPRPGFLTTLADPSLVPVPESADDDLDAFAAQPVGNGPFAMAAPREVGQFLRLSRFAEHHEPALLDEVLLTVYLEDPGRERQWDDLEDGLLQVAEVAPERFDEAAASFGTSEDGYTGPGLLRGTTSTVYLYAFDVTRPPFDDVRVRRAISQAIDRDALADEVLQGAREPATAIVPTPIPGAQPGRCLACRYDPEGAAALLAEASADPATSGDDTAEEAEEAGEADDDAAADEDEAAEDVEAGDPVLERVTLAYNRGPTHAAIAERMAADLERALDLEVDVSTQDLQAFVQAVRRGDHQLFRLGWETNEPDPGAYLFPLFHSSQVGLDNLSRYESTEVDELLEAARAAEDRDEALRSYRAAERLILEDLPVVPLLWYQHALVVTPSVRDLHVSPFGRMGLARAWLDAEAP